MAGNKPSHSAKGKAKAYPTRASPRLAALRSQSTAKPQPETPVTPAVTAPTPSLPPKKRPIQKAAGEGTSKATAQSFHKQSQGIAAIGHTFIQASKEQEVIAISSDSEPEPAIKDTIREIVEMDEDEEEDPEEDPEEAPQDAEVEAEVEEEEDPEGDPEEKSAAEEVLREEDDFADYWALVDSESEDTAGDDPYFWDYDGDLPNWRNANPSNSSSGSCTGPPPANL
ncbi:hypothetical protein PIB30_086480 [Stylosanthes scabra]|uniref:Uncharacterized protein n=1 Tax=Stylosanthes scabra TaxID=79078 RepID=A0ABU6WRG7_9FABA|nr:hypothetical protein [Stylosanthes scabra]